MILLSRLQSYSREKYFFDNIMKNSELNADDNDRNNSPSTPPWRVIGNGLYNSVKLIINVQPINFKHFCNHDGYGTIVSKFYSNISIIEASIHSIF